MKFSERLRELRKGKKETQIQTANAVEITSRQLQELEAGKSFPNFHTLWALADHFGVSVDYLMGRSNERV